MKRRMIVIILLMAVTAFGGEIKVKDPASVEKFGKLVVDNLLGRDYMLYREGHGLHYAEACAGLGALRFSAKIDDKESVEKLVERYSGFLKDEDTLIDRVQHVDHNVMAIVPLQIYLTTGNEAYKKAGMWFADAQWDKEIEGGLTSQTRWWIDDMYMIGSLQMQAYRATGDAEYADKAARQIHAYIDKLQQANGLFYHGPKFPHHWGRGNGWVASSMAELIKDLPKDNAHWPAIEKSYKKMMVALLKYQADNGMWRQLIDNEYSWTETSCTAMFAYAMAVGVNRGVLDADEYGPAVAKAWEALCWHVNRDGNIRDVCVGTGQQDDVEFYLNRPRVKGDFHGQAPFLWLAAELVN